MNRSILLSFCLIWLPGGYASAESASGQEVWRNTAIDFIESVGSDPTQEDILRLGTYAGIRGRGNAISNLQAEVADAAREKLLMVPNHASHFEARLLDLRRVRSEKEKYIDYNYERQQLFRTLAQIPSPQVVDLLIRLLDDDQDYKYYEPGAEILGNDTQAASVLCSVIENPPVPKLRFGYARDLAAWKKWGEEVREGGRTFRFKGDPQLYNIRGPVAPVPKRFSRGLDENTTAFTPDEEEAESPFSWIPLGSALVLLAGATWWYARGQKSA